MNPDATTVCLGSSVTTLARLHTRGRERLDKWVSKYTAGFPGVNAAQDRTRRHVIKGRRPRPEDGE